MWFTENWSILIAVTGEKHEETCAVNVKPCGDLPGGSERARRGTIHKDQPNVGFCIQAHPRPNDFGGEVLPLAGG